MKRAHHRRDESISNSSKPTNTKFDLFKFFGKCFKRSNHGRGSHLYFSKNDLYQHQFFPRFLLVRQSLKRNVFPFSPKIQGWSITLCSFQLSTLLSQKLKSRHAIVVESQLSFYHVELWINQWYFLLLAFCHVQTGVQRLLSCHRFGSSVAS